jgi:hypothetical protein
MHAGRCEPSYGAHVDASRRAGKVQSSDAHRKGNKGNDGGKVRRKGENRRGGEKKIITLWTFYHFYLL